MDKLNPRYELYISNRLDEPDNTKEFVLSAKKKKQGQASQYSISTVRDFSVKDNEGVIGMVRGNFLGTAFVVYDTGTNPFKSKRKREKGVRKEYAAVIYEPNIMGFKGPRKMTILLPGMTRQGTRTDIEPLEQKDTLLERYRNQNDREILTVYNKAPQWNEETGSFVLNFNGRVTLASVKNFQVVHDNDLDYIILQFGRVSEDTFTIDFAYPMSPLQAFGIALTRYGEAVLFRGAGSSLCLCGSKVDDQLEFMKRFLKADHLSELLSLSLGNTYPGLDHMHCMKSLKEHVKTLTPHRVNMSGKQSKGKEDWQSIPNSYIDKSYGGTHQFMGSYGLKPTPDGYQEAKEIRDAFKEESWKSGEYQADQANQGGSGKNKK
ncbi:hypothetical protein HK097_008618 [Rhizophlyctis rosea]|uniref:Tubby C-terminal domain-containing protein n=1 Tax=Rhizophlyctis rosea TaxID=64517 RepID=A0AAD5SDA5_9FUNG|nr:hypothetical protein HK097_008618 [Rhizophlyctis rosea]